MSEGKNFTLWHIMLWQLSVSRRCLWPNNQIRVTTGYHFPLLGWPGFWNTFLYKSHLLPQMISMALGRHLSLCAICSTPFNWKLQVWYLEVLIFLTFTFTLFLQRMLLSLAMSLQTYSLSDMPPWYDSHSAMSQEATKISKKRSF